MAESLRREWGRMVDPEPEFHQPIPSIVCPIPFPALSSATKLKYWREGAIITISWISAGVDLQSPMARPARPTSAPWSVTLKMTMMGNASHVKGHPLQTPTGT